MSTIIRNGRIVTADRDFHADVLIEGETIAAVGQDLQCEEASVIDAAGKYVIPGGVDAHTHLDMPYCGTVSSDDFATGTRAAAFGGTTCLIDFAVQSKGTTMEAALEAWLRKGQTAALDYGLHMIVTDLPPSGEGAVDRMVEAGVTSFKLFMAYPDTLMVDDRTILRVLRRSSENGSLVCVHAEDGALIETLRREAVASGRTAPIHHALTRPPASETEAVERAVLLAETARAPIYIVHVSTAGSMETVAAARARGLPVFAETCPQYLLLSSANLQGPSGARYVYTPPPRAKEDQERLWLGLARKELQVVATDHCPVMLEEKLAAARQDFTMIPNGGPGIENRMQLLFHFGVNQGRLRLSRWVDLVSTAPAKMFGLFPRKGAIAKGSDADIVIWNPDAEVTVSARTHHMRVDYSLYEGFQLRGSAELVLSRGEVIVEEGAWLGRYGRGRFLMRGPSGRDLDPAV